MRFGNVVVVCALCCCWAGGDSFDRSIICECDHTQTHIRTFGIARSRRAQQQPLGPNTTDPDFGASDIVFSLYNVFMHNSSATRTPFGWRTQIWILIAGLNTTLIVRVVRSRFRSGQGNTNPFSRVYNGGCIVRVYVGKYHRFFNTAHSFPPMVF